MLPDFLREEDNAKVKVAKEGYVEKSLSGYLKVSQWFFKRSKSLFTRIDEWAKLLFLIWFSLLVSISNSILFLAVAFTFVLVVAAISKASYQGIDCFILGVCAACYIYHKHSLYANNKEYYASYFAGFKDRYHYNDR